MGIEFLVQINQNILDKHKNGGSKRNCKGTRSTNKHVATQEGIKKATRRNKIKDIEKKVKLFED